MRTPSLYPRRRAFTLVELLVATALLVIVALLATKFFANLQNVWQHSAGRTTTHEDARLALELIARDLLRGQARADDRPGLNILIHQPSDSQLWFVTDAAAETTVSCAFVEVGYRLTEDRLERAVVDESCSAWNIYGDRDDADDQDGYRTVIDGVVGLRFVCYDGQYLVTTPNQTYQMPTLITIRLSVLDARDLARWKALSAAARPAFEKLTARTFWKTIQPQ
jgi:prepilin-type N-terminal cleavage/methylation domain-containing protein